MIPKCPLCGGIPEAARTAVRCPSCGLEARETETSTAMEGWIRMCAQMRGMAPDLAACLEIIEAMDDALGDLEAIRRLPGAMDAWHRISEALGELRAIVEAGARCWNVR